MAGILWPLDLSACPIQYVQRQLPEPPKPPPPKPGNVQYTAKDKWAGKKRPVSEKSAAKAAATAAAADAAESSSGSISSLSFVPVVSRRGRAPTTSRDDDDWPTEQKRIRNMTDLEKAFSSISLDKSTEAGTRAVNVANGLVPTGSTEQESTTTTTQPEDSGIDAAIAYFAEVLAHTSQEDLVAITPVVLEGSVLLQRIKAASLPRFRYRFFVSSPDLEIDKLVTDVILFARRSYIHAANVPHLVTAVTIALARCFLVKKSEDESMETTLARAMISRTRLSNGITPDMYQLAATGNPGVHSLADNGIGKRQKVIIPTFNNLYLAQNDALCDLFDEDIASKLTDAEKKLVTTNPSGAVFHISFRSQIFHRTMLVLRAISKMSVRDAAAFALHKKCMDACLKELEFIADTASKEVAERTSAAKRYFFSASSQLVPLLDKVDPTDADVGGRDVDLFSYFAANDADTIFVPNLLRLLAFGLPDLDHRLVQEDQVAVLARFIQSQPLVRVTDNAIAFFMFSYVGTGASDDSTMGNYVEYPEALKRMLTTIATYCSKFNPAEAEAEQQRAAAALAAGIRERVHQETSYANQDGLLDSIGKFKESLLDAQRKLSRLQWENATASGLALSSLSESVRRSQDYCNLCSMLCSKTIAELVGWQQ